MGPMLQREPSGLPSFAIKVNNKIFKIFKQSLQSSSLSIQQLQPSFLLPFYVMYCFSLVKNKVNEKQSISH